MADSLYFWIFRNVKNFHIRFNLMGVIAFYKSVKKHLFRKHPLWMVTAQVRGIGMSIRQLLD
jgi:hypothetical protein